MVHLRSNAYENDASRPSAGQPDKLQSPCNALTLESTILKIFWTLIECEVEQKMSGAFIAREKRLAWVAGKRAQV